MLLVEGLYLVATATLVLAGFTMVGMAVEAYAETKRHSMLFVTLGFSLVTLAALSTAIGAFLSDFRGVRSLLLIDNGFSALGFILVVYSLVSYE